MVPDTGIILEKWPYIGDESLAHKRRITTYKAAKYCARALGWLGNTRINVVPENETIVSQDAYMWDDTKMRQDSFVNRIRCNSTRRDCIAKI
jgi:hypothetical protein